MHKNLQLTIAWFVLAFLVTITAVWQAQVTVAREVAVRNQLPPPPLKTRHAERISSSVSPAVDYATRRKQGLTDQQIGWIVGDFQTAGLDLGTRVATREEFLAQRQAQDRWYHDALVEAWSLTPDQSAQVTGKLAELYDQAKADFIEALAAGPRPFEVNGKWYNITSADPIQRLLDANLRLQDTNGPFMPWNLGGFLVRSLTPRFENTDTTAVPEQPYEDIVITEPIQIVPASPSLVTVDFLLPKSAPSPAEEPIQITPQEDGILPQFRKLHPAELKLLLLIAPEEAQKIQQALDAAP